MSSMRYCVTPLGLPLLPLGDGGLGRRVAPVALGVDSLVVTVVPVVGERLGAWLWRRNNWSHGEYLDQHAGGPTKDSWPWLDVIK